MGADCEHIKPYGDSHPEEAKESQVSRMFDHIAPSYDLLNRIMTLGVDRLWRRKAVAMVAAEHPRYILDVATGTADLALQLARRADPVEVVGVDLSEGMLAIGRRKVEQRGMADVITLRQADSLALPFTDGRFDSVTCAFGVRNFASLEQGLREMWRVTRPGGQLVVLELSSPRGRLTAPLHRFYTLRVIPFVGRLVSADRNAYIYLPLSVAAVPQGQEMAQLMKQAGYSTVEVRELAFGACTIYRATKAKTQCAD